MKKKLMTTCTLLFAFIMIFFLSACNNNNESETIAADGETLYVECTLYEGIEVEDEITQNTERRTQLPSNITCEQTLSKQNMHPFAIALAEYFEGVEVSVDHWGTKSTHAFLVDIDGKGTGGMLASSGDDIRLFALHNGKISYINIPHDISPNVTEQGRQILGYFWGGIQYGYTLFGLRHGKVNIDFSIHTQISDEDFASGEWVPIHSNENNVYSFIPNNFIHTWMREDGVEYWNITHEQFHSMMERHSLAWENSIWWRDIPDETEEILAMEVDSDTQFSLSMIEDFLFPLHIMFSYANDRDSGALISYEFAEGMWFNRYGERVSEPWFVDGGTVPWGFSLYDFENTGVPEILIYYGGFHFGGPPFPTVYRFVDGSYVPMVSLGRMPRFFLDREGRVVVHYNVDYGGSYGYFYLFFDDIGGREHGKEYIITPDPNDMESWNEHHRYPYFDQNPTIYTMPEETLVPILPLTELEELITHSIRQRHGLE